MKKLLNALHSFFVPKEENNFHAKALHLQTLTVYLLLVLFAGVILGKLHAQSDNVLGFATDITTTKLLELTNEKRVENGLTALSYNDKLASAAQAKAQHMFTNNYWAHYAPDGTAPWDFILSSGYQYSFAGENLAKNFMFSADVVEAWMNSPTHRENMLRTEYKDVGYAIANGVLNGDETTLVVQMFGTPQQSQEQAQTTDTSAPRQEVAAASAPTSAPAAETQISPAPSAVLAHEVNQPRFNLFPLYLNMNYIFIGIFLLAVLYDFYLASRLHIIRITGKNLAHFIFIVFMLIGLTIIIKGAIL